MLFKYIAKIFRKIAMLNLKVFQEEEKQPIIARKISNIDKPLQLHFHENYEISYIIRGGHQYLVDGHIYTIEDHDLFLIGSNQIHTASSLPDTVMERYMAKFRSEVTTPFMGICDLTYPFRLKLHKISVPVECRKELSDLFANLIRARLGKSYAEEVLRLYDLLVYVGELSKNRGIPSDHLSRSRSGVIAGLIGFIHSHLEEDLTLEKLADQALMSKYHLSRVFKAEIGTTIHQYILAARVALASRLLEQGGHLNEIYVKSGFGSYAHFIYSFRKIKGISPLRYQKAHQKNGTSFI